MLTAFHLGNFKAFSNTQCIPIRPLTLIFGPNSGGKSSIIHGLVLAHEANRAGNMDVTRTEVGGDSVDLGGFRQFVHRQDLSRNVEIALELDTARLKGEYTTLLAPVKHVTVSMTIGMRQVEGKGGELVATGMPMVTRYELLADGESLLRASWRASGSMKVDILAQDHAVFREITKAIVLLGTTTESMSPEDYEWAEKAISGLVPELLLKAGNLLPAGLADSLLRSSVGLIPVSIGQRRGDLAEAIEAFLPSRLNDLIAGISTAVAQELGSFNYLGPLRSYPPRHLAFSDDGDRNWFAGGGNAWDVLRRDESVRKRVNDWLSNRERLSTPYMFRLDKLVTIESINPLYEELVRDLEDRYCNHWSEEDIDIFGEVSGTLLDVEQQLDKVNTISELRLVDLRTDTAVTHRDVGIGVSQVVPVLVAAYGSREKLWAIEQPEIHIHPALQAELGDVFIESALGANGNRFLLETHSEHLILRILRRIRETSEGTRPEGLPKIRPEHVQVLYVDPSATGSQVVELRLPPSFDRYRGNLRWC